MSWKELMARFHLFYFRVYTACTPTTVAIQQHSHDASNSHAFMITIIRVEFYPVDYYESHNRSAVLLTAACSVGVVTDVYKKA